MNIAFELPLWNNFSSWNVVISSCRRNQNDFFFKFFLLWLVLLLNPSYLLTFNMFSSFPTQVNFQWFTSSSIVLIAGYDPIFLCFHQLQIRIYHLTKTVGLIVTTWYSFLLATRNKSRWSLRIMWTLWSCGFKSNKFLYILILLRAYYSFFHWFFPFQKDIVMKICNCKLIQCFNGIFIDYYQIHWCTLMSFQEEIASHIDTRNYFSENA